MTSQHALTAVNNMPEVAKDMAAATLEKVIIGGDLASLAPSERLEYYAAVCRSAGLNPLTKPFEYISLDGRLTLYALKGATDQIRSNKKISVQIVKRERENELYIVTARAKLPDGREDESIAVVPLTREDGEWKETKNGKRYFDRNGRQVPLAGADLANALMKCETKSKRRVTLSIAGLGLLDETELETVASAQVVAVDDAGRIENTAVIAEALEQCIEQAGTLVDLGVAGKRIADAKRQGSISDADAKALRQRYAAQKTRLTEAVDLETGEILQAAPAAPTPLPEIPDDWKALADAICQDWTEGRPEAAEEALATIGDEDLRALIRAHAERLETAA